MAQKHAQCPPLGLRLLFERGRHRADPAYPTVSRARLNALGVFALALPGR